MGPAIILNIIIITWFKTIIVFTITLMHHDSYIYNAKYKTYNLDHTQKTLYNVTKASFFVLNPPWVFMITIFDKPWTPLMCIIERCSHVAFSRETYRSKHGYRLLIYRTEYILSISKVGCFKERVDLWSWVLDPPLVLCLFRFFLLFN